LGIVVSSEQKLNPSRSYGDIENLSSIAPWTPAWDSVEIKLTDEEVYRIYTSYLDVLKDVSDTDGYASYFQYRRPGLHFIDFDHDKDPDIIFNGKWYPGSESEHIDVYECQKDNSYKRVFIEVGKILKIDLSDPDSCRMIVFNYPCCAEYRNFIKHYKVSGKDSLSFELRSISGFIASYARGQEFLPAKVTMDQKFEFICDSVIVQWSPKLDTAKRERFIIEWNDINNWGITAVFYRGDKGTILATYKNELNEDWFFVQMQYSERTRANNLLYPASQKLHKIYPSEGFKGMKVYGWIKAKPQSLKVTK
jgi:hypothetical protein